MSEYFSTDYMYSSPQALAWCPWQLEQVAVGGGRQDGALRVWDTHTGVCRQSVQTHSQVGVCMPSQKPLLVNAICG